MDRRRESLMKKIQEQAFVAHECVLYLDCHPNNKKALRRHAEAVKAMKDYTKQYEGLYGPLRAEDAGGSESSDSWNWTKGKWPWQKED